MRRHTGLTGPNGWRVDPLGKSIGVRLGRVASAVAAAAAATSHCFSGFGCPCRQLTGLGDWAGRAGGPDDMRHAGRVAASRLR